MKLAIMIISVIIGSLLTLGFLIALAVTLMTGSGDTESDKGSTSGLITKREHQPYTCANTGVCSYDVYVAYSVDGTSYTCKKEALPTTPRSVGEKVMIEYDKYEPSLCNLQESSFDKILYLSFGAFAGLALIVVGVATYLNKNEYA